MALTEIDRNLLQRCLTEQPGAWKDFVDRFIGLFIHVVNHTAHARSAQLTQADLDDVNAEIFLALLKDKYDVLRRFRGKCSLATYLAVIARRVAVREISKKRMAEAMGHVGASKPGAAAKSVAAPHERRLDDQEEIQRMLAELPDADAEVVRQFHLEGKSYREISSGLGIPENSIGPTLTRAREKMRKGVVPAE